MALKSKELTQGPEEAWRNGNAFYLYESRTTRDVPVNVETIEAYGWKLECMSYVWSTALGMVGYYLFRRP